MFVAVVKRQIRKVHEILRPEIHPIGYSRSWDKRLRSQLFLVVFIEAPEVFSSGFHDILTLAVVLVYPFFLIFSCTGRSGNESDGNYFIELIIGKHFSIEFFSALGVYLDHLFEKPVFIIDEIRRTQIEPIICCNVEKVHLCLAQLHIGIIDKVDADIFCQLQALFFERKSPEMGDITPVVTVKLPFADELQFVSSYIFFLTNHVAGIIERKPSLSLNDS